MEFHVLLVEDDQVTLKTVEQLLRKCDYKVTCAANGREAIKVLTACRQSGVKVDLILTDILMPEVTGFDLINEVVHGDTFCHVPVVVMSSQDSQESVLQAFQAGAADYLIKPIRKNELATLWQHVWRANKAKGSGSGTTAIANGQPLVHREDLDGAAAATHGHLKGSSGSSSGAVTSVLHSTGGTMLPTRAATERQSSAALLPGASELSGSLRAVETQDSKCKLREQVPGHGGVAATVAAVAAVQGSNAGGPFLGIGSGGGATAPRPCASSGPRSFAPLSTSVAVHFDLNPTPGSATKPNYISTINAAVGNGMATAAVASHCPRGTAATVISWSHVDRQESDRAAVDGDADVDVTAAAVAVAIGEVDDNGVEGDGGGDGSGEYENPPRKRQRLLTGHVNTSHNHHNHHSYAGPASTTATTAGQLKAATVQRAGSEVLLAGAAAQSAGGAAAAAQGGGGSSCRMAAAEGSQGSRAASASAGPDGGARDATPSGDTFAESPSAYTANASTTTTTTTTTTGSGSEADEQHQQEQQQRASTERVVRGPSPAVEAGTRKATAVGMHGTGMHSKISAGPGHGGAITGPPATAAGVSVRDRSPIGLEPYADVDAPVAAMTASAQRDVDGGDGAAAAPASRSRTSVPAPQQHSLPHPAAAAPPAATSPGGTVTLPPALQELAALGAARHQELWTQRALMHQQQMQQKQRQKQQQKLPEALRAGPTTCPISAAAAGQHQHQHQHTARRPSDAIAGVVGAEGGTKSGSVGRSGSGTSSSALVAAEPLGAGCSKVTAAASPVQRQEASEGVDGFSAAASQPRPDRVLADGDSGGSLHPGKAPMTASTAAAAAACANGGGSAGPSQPSDSLTLLRHSDRSAFTAFTVFLPGRVAASAARPPPPSVPVPAPLFGHPVATAATAPAAAGGGGPSVLYPQHQFAQRTHPTSSLPPPPPAAVPILPTVMPIHVNVPPQPPHLRVAQPPKPSDAGVHGALGSAAAAAAAAVAAAAQMPYPDMQQLPGALAAMAFSPPPPGHAAAGLPPPHLAAAAAAASVGSAPPAAVRIPESVLQLIAHLSGRAAAELPVPETVAAAPIVVQKAPSAARLAAVAKYLEKRKHRNFQKKVRYESRKRLAEARPRVRGQFVKANTAAVVGAGLAASAAVAEAEAISPHPVHAAQCVLVTSSGMVAARTSGGKASAAAAAVSPTPTPTPSGGADPAESELPDQDADMEDNGAEPEEDSDESAAEP